MKHLCNGFILNNVKLTHFYFIHWSVCQSDAEISFVCRFLPKLQKINKCVREIVGNAGHLLVFAQCVRDTGQDVEMRDCSAECGTIGNYLIGEKFVGEN